MIRTFAIARLFFAGALFSISAHAASVASSVNFLGRTYDVTVITLADPVGPVSTNDLIFVQTPAGQRFFAIPSDVTARGDFDVATQRFYMLDRTNGQINAFGTISAVLVNLDGTLFSTSAQSPATGQAPLETFGKALGISETVVCDCTVVDSRLMGYRTDGPALTDEKVYTITRQSASSVQETIPLLLKNADPANGNLTVFLTYDRTDNLYLLSQSVLDPANNVDKRNRISAYRRDGTIADELVLDGNTNLTQYKGGAAGITMDQTSGTIYLLDVNARQILAFVPRSPTLTSIVPTSGGFRGGTPVTINGQNFPPDAKVFFDGILAGNIVVQSGTIIKATTPPHARGPADVTVTGSGIAAPLRLPAAYSFVDAPPNAVLAASPVSGPPPLIVSFNVSGTADPDGNVITRVLDYGDSNRFTFPGDLSITAATHTYTAPGTYIATFTVTDDGGVTGSVAATIIVGSGGEDVFGNLVLRTLQFKLQNPSGRDTALMKGEIVIPADTDLANAKLTVDFGGVEFMGILDLKKRIKTSLAAFTIKLLKKRGFDPDTQTFTFTQKSANLRPGFTAAGLDLTHDGRGSLPIFIRLVDTLGRTFQFAKTAVVDIKAARSGASKVTLRRE